MSALFNCDAAPGDRFASGRWIFALVCTVATCVGCTPNLATRFGSQNVPTYALVVGQLPANSQRFEGQPSDVTFVLTTNVEIGDPPPVDVLVCSENRFECIVLSAVRSRDLRTGVMKSIRLPLAGQPLTLIACRPILTGTSPPLCGEMLATASFNFQLKARYSFAITSVTTLVTRAKDTDSVWIDIIGQTSDGHFVAADCGGIPNTLCSLAQPAGELQQGSHALKWPFLPSVGSFVVAPTTRVSIAFAVWNFGFELIRDWRDLDNALYAEAVPVFATIAPSEEISLTSALNSHTWYGCDGPTAGSAVQFTGADLDELTVATGHFEKTYGPYVVASQLGCGASARYTVTLYIDRESWFAPEHF